MRLMYCRLEPDRSTQLPLSRCGNKMDATNSSTIAYHACSIDAYENNFKHKTCTHSRLIRITIHEIYLHGGSRSSDVFHVSLKATSNSFR